MRVLIDTNVFISYLLFPTPQGAIGKIFEGLFAGRLTLLMPEELLDEIEATIFRKPKLVQRIGRQRLSEFISLIKELCEEIARIEQPIPQVSRDPKDDYLIVYAVIGEANYLVSGDKDLLVLRQIEKVEILTPQEFATKLQT
jgi:putative PIN family toxin of toxin-antitoxin system